LTDGPIISVSANGYTCPVATRHPRVQVPRDPDLERAIKRGRAALGASTPISRVVRELALRGAEALDEDQAAEQRAVEFALSVAEGTSGLNLESLRGVRERAWGR
jgi:hypothetical protein